MSSSTCFVRNTPKHNPGRTVKPLAPVYVPMIVELIIGCGSALGQFERVCSSNDPRGPVVDRETREFLLDRYPSVCLDGESHLLSALSQDGSAIREHANCYCTMAWLLGECSNRHHYLRHVDALATITRNHDRTAWDSDSLPCLAEVALLSLGESGAPEAVDALASMVDTGIPYELFEVALSTLSRRDPGRAAHMALDLLSRTPESKDRKPRYAVELTKALGGTSTTEILEYVLKSLEVCPDIDEKQALLAVASRYSDDRVIRALVVNASDPCQRISHYAWSALANKRDKRTVALAYESLQSTDGLIAYYAAYLLRNTLDTGPDPARDKRDVIQDFWKKRWEWEPPELPTQYR